MIIELISKYLQTNKRLVVPKLGAFIVKEATQSILFSNLIKGDDGVLRGLLVSEGVLEIEAAATIDRFVFEVKDRLEKDGKCSLKGFGELRTGANGTLAFVYNPAIGGDVLDGNIDSRVAEATPIATPSAAKPQPKQEPTPVEEDVQNEVVPRKPQVKAEQRVDAVQPATSRKSDAERRPRSQEEYVKGLRYGKGRKVVTGREGATSRKSSKGDIIIKVAIAAAVVAILALCYGFWNDWRQSRMDEPYIDNSQIYEQEPQSAEGEVRNPDLDYITPKEN